MKKTLQLLLMALFTFTFASAQDLFPVGNFNYRVTSQDPVLEVEVAGYIDGFDPLENIIISDKVLIDGKEYTVVGIGESAFQADATLKTVSLPSTVVTIGSNAFKACKALTTINLENVVTLENSCFSTTGLTEVDLSSCVSIGNYAFHLAKGFTNITLSDNLENLGTGFSENGLVSVSIPNSVTNIGKLLFRKCNSLAQVQVNWLDPENEVTVIVNDKHFENISGTVKLYVPENTKTKYLGLAPWNLIPSENIIEGDMPVSKLGNTFTVDDINYVVTSVDPAEVEVSGSTLAEVVIPETITDSETSTVYTVTAVGNAAFMGTDDLGDIDVLANLTLTSVVLPSTVILLKSDAFSRCQNLESINLENVQVLETKNVFFDCPKLTEANLSLATDIGTFAFHGFANSTLTSIDISSAVNIYDSAFRTSQIPSINIPKSVVTLERRSFMDCTALTQVQVNWNTSEGIPVITSDVFANLTLGDITLYVPTGTASLYADAAVWQDFNVVEGALSTEDIVNDNLNIQVSANELTVISSSTFTNGNLSIYDVTGRVLSNTALNSSSVSVNISNLASGIYIVKVIEGNAKLVKRFVKQ